MKKILFLLFLSLVFSGLIFADYKSDVTNGVKAYKSGDYKTAYNLFSNAYKTKPSQKLMKYVKAAYTKMKEQEENVDKFLEGPAEYGGWSTKQNIISTNPLTLALGYLALHYERAITNSISAGVSAGYVFGGVTVSSGNSTVNVSGFSAGANVDYYFEGKALNGWFAGPSVDYLSQSAKTEYEDFFSGDTITSETNFTYILAGARAGYRWIFDMNLTVDLTLGFSYVSANVSGDDSSMYIALSGILPSGGASVGYAF